MLEQLGHLIEYFALIGWYQQGNHSDYHIINSAGLRCFVRYPVEAVNCHSPHTKPHTPFSPQQKHKQAHRYGVLNWSIQFQLKWRQFNTCQMCFIVAGFKYSDKKLAFKNYLPINSSHLIQSLWIVGWYYDHRKTRCYFTTFRPTTALDMGELVPDF